MFRLTAWLHYQVGHGQEKGIDKGDKTGFLVNLESRSKLRILAGQPKGSPDPAA